MTDQQLRALRRKHLLVIIRDLEKDLQKAVSDKEQLLLAYQAGQEQKDARAQLPPELPQQQAWQFIDSGRTDWQQQAFQPQQYAAPYEPQAWPGGQQPTDMGYAQEPWQQDAYTWQQDIRPQELWLQQGAASYG